MSDGFDKTDEAIKAMQDAVETALLAAIIDLHGQAAELAPVKTGNLKGSLSWTVAGQKGGLEPPAEDKDGVNVTQDKDTAYLGTNVEYGAAVEFGTKAHTITVKDARVLTDGKTFFGKSVEHPGTKPQPFLRPAYDARKPHTEKIMREHFEKALRRATQ